MESFHVQDRRRIGAMNRVRLRSAGFQTCCVADFQVGAVEFGWPADLEIRDTADLEVCATLVAGPPRCAVSSNCILLHIGKRQRARTFGRSADYKSAIRQLKNPRYDAALCAKHIIGIPSENFRIL